MIFQNHTARLVFFVFIILLPVPPSLNPHLVDGDDVGLVPLRMSDDVVKFVEKAHRVASAGGAVV